MATQQGFPSSVSPIVEVEKGLIRQAWMQLLVSLWTRTGKGTGIVLPTPWQMVTVGASPYSYTAPLNGAVAVYGGTVTALELVRNGVSLNAGVTGYVPIAATDVLVITYAVLPTVVMIPISI